MITREQALAFILMNEKIARRDFKNFVLGTMAHNHILPPGIRGKFLAAGDQYGAFDLNQDWLSEMESELWDGIMYAGLNRLKSEIQKDKFFDFRSALQP